MEYIHMMGSFYEVIEGKLYYIPSLDTNPPTPDFKNYGLVTDVTADGIKPGKQLLAIVNRKFNTNFTLEDFDGR